ncbi:hypothetical protein [Segniliparus rugosus]|uniref:Secreted protein n=1 Tax=Segniliparus rugosus (strain ATCC BAA-974 / DSM 45345 / CCUG 50838 / CIP 108380 / JCM 13579 / CDC 945) TaxID=679197 RepID=E5XUK6_SEGRC|nr:hypothetical protein [Segniliparus rugosus]EFV11985.1 hypothetical protein HMPREF9336_03178 [Segniliparus rugosus ATCC BAA-974]
MSIFSHARTRRNASLTLVGLAALAFGSSPSAMADDSAIDLAFFKSTPCSGTQIYHAIERVAPAELAKVRSGPVGSRRQKWLLNWLIRTREAVDAGSVIPDFEDKSGGMFGDLDWRTLFMPYEKEIAADCPNE